MTGYTLSFDASSESRQLGETTYTWNFGNGVTKTENIPSVLYAYPSAGTYTVVLTKQNPEYGSATASAQVTIYPAISNDVCAAGPVKVDVCARIAPVPGSCTSGSITNSSPTTLKATALGGCSALTYSWEVETAPGTWSAFASTAQASPPSAFVNRTRGTYNVRCVARDTCGNSYVSATIVLDVYSSGC
jgi:PKD repeat protein